MAARCAFAPGSVAARWSSCAYRRARGQRRGWKTSTRPLERIACFQLDGGPPRILTNEARTARCVSTTWAASVGKSADRKHGPIAPECPGLRSADRNSKADRAAEFASDRETTGPPDAEPRHPPLRSRQAAQPYPGFAPLKYPVFRETPRRGPVADIA